MTIKELLINYRAKKEKTQEEVANEIGISLVTYSNLENGKQDVSMLTKAKIANFFNIDIKEIE